MFHPPPAGFPVGIAFQIYLRLEKSAAEANPLHLS
jgi:hypothetical protein